MSVAPALSVPTVAVPFTVNAFNASDNKSVSVLKPTVVPVKYKFPVPNCALVNTVKFPPVDVAVPSVSVPPVMVPVAVIAPVTLNAICGLVFPIPTLPVKLELPFTVVLVGLFHL